MNDTNYTRLFLDQMAKLSELHKQRKQIDEQIKHVNALTKAAFNMMPDADKKRFAEIYASAQQERAGLTDTIKRILTAFPDGLSATEIKEKLEQDGFDFSGYASNPLSSIHAVVKRIKGVRRRTLIDGSVQYRLPERKQDAATRAFYGKS